MDRDAYFFQKNMRIAIAQINPTLGDLAGNAKKIIYYIKRAKAFGADIVSFPELALTGYPPEDLLFKHKFIQDNLKELKRIVKVVNDIVAIVGFVDNEADNIYNAAGVIYNHKIQGVYRKIFLPNYGVFDEKRYFIPGTKAYVFEYKDSKFGVTICEDIWYKDGPLKEEAKNGAKIVFNINASVYHSGKIKERESIIQEQAKSNKVTIVYTNLIGGQDELVFDGQSMIADKDARIIARLDAFKEDFLILDLEDKTKMEGTIKKRLGHLEEIYQALTLGLKDYVSKNGFKKVVIGLSGGIDSSLVATLSVDALGSDNVIGVFMPSRYSSRESEEDARQLAYDLGIKFMHISIEQIYKIYLMALEPHFIGSERDVTEENIQARIRGNILMALSNKFGWLVLSTGNKSEMSTGYATLYGDMAGGLAVIKDVPKTLVYKLATYRNGLSPVIPERIITKAPTAELKPNQKDSDTLPAYDVLDKILKAYIEEDKDSGKIKRMGFEKEIVDKAVRLVDKSEYKRRQSGPGIKITPKAFGRDRRMPITNKYK